MTTPPARLDYARPKPFLTRRRVRWIVLGVLVLTLGVTALWNRRWIDIQCRQIETLYWQRQCAAFSIAPDQVVYDDDPARVADPTGASQTGGLTREIAYPDGHTALIWDHYFFTILWLRAAPLPPTPQGTIFLHERFTPAGERFILACIVIPGAKGDSAEFQLHEFRPASWSRGVARRNSLITTIPEIDRALAEGKHVRLYGGQPDPADRTHFTIRCEIDGVEETIDGWEGDRTVDATSIPTPGLRLQMRPRKN